MSKVRAIEEIWDRIPRKLLVYVIEGVSLVTTKTVASPFVRLAIDKQKHKTASVSKSEDPTWKELFIFEIADPGVPLELEVHTKHQVGADKMIGQAKVPLPVDSQDEVVDCWVDLELPAKMKEKNKDLLDGRLGNIHLRMLYSTAKETPASVPPNEGYDFTYDDYKDQFKTGDLIVYSGIGVMDALVQITSNSKFSRIAMVVKHPNKWTGKSKLFLLEITRNVGGFCDAFSEKIAPGINLFRFDERVHFVNAKTIYWVPLKEPLDAATGEQNMTDWIMEVHDGRQPFPEVPPLPSEIVTFFDKMFEVNLSKHQMAISEASSAQIFMTALRLGGRRFAFEHEFLAPVHLIAAPAFNDAIPIRQWNDKMIVHQRPRSTWAPSELVRSRSTTESIPLLGTSSSPLDNAAAASASAAAASPSPSRPHASTVSGLPPHSGSKERSLSADVPSSKKRSDTTVPELRQSAAVKDSGATPDTLSAALDSANNTSNGNMVSTDADIIEVSDALANGEKKKRPGARAPPPPSRVGSSATLADDYGIEHLRSQSVGSVEGLGAQMSPRKPGGAQTLSASDITSGLSVTGASPDGRPSSERLTRPKKEKKTFTKSDKSSNGAADQDDGSSQQKGEASPRGMPLLQVEQAHVANTDGKSASPRKSPSPRFKKPTSPRKKEAVKKRPDISSQRLSTRFKAKEIQLQETEFYRATMRCQFVAENAGELSVDKGVEVIVLDSKEDPEWALVRIADKEDEVGCVPRSFLRKFVVAK